MTAMLWDQLHKQAKHQLRYPSEHVVRWLASLERGGAAIDIGCGSGRHLHVFKDFGFRAVGVDTSETRLGVKGDMRDLQWPDDTFDVALAYGVFYYGTNDDHSQAVSELHRVLKPGGHALVVTRTHDDSRAGLIGRDGRVVTGDEKGMLMNFMGEQDIWKFYSVFSGVRYELTETTRHDRVWVDSDWLIMVTK